MAKSRKGRKSKSKKGSRKTSCKGGRNNSLFKNYLSNLRNNLNGGSSRLFDQDGGGYSMNINNPVTNLPEVSSYSDCCPPALVDGQLVQSSGDTPVCSPNQYGGRKKGKSKSKKSKSGKKTKKRVCGGKRKSSKKKGSKSKKTKRKSGKRKKSQSGGMNAEYPGCISGQESDFSGDMNNRQFGCSQPGWEANCI